MTAVRPQRTPQPVDVDAEPHLSGVFAPQLAEIDSDDLVVDGELPAEIDGDYVRNGPNPRFTPLGGYLYPLDGDGMLHRVRFRDGRARYSNRFVRTPALRCEEAAGRALWPGITSFGSTPGAELVGPALAHTVKDLPGINVVRHAGRLLALAESNNPFLISPQLDTIGRETFCGAVPAGITAHPKIDPATGEMVVFCYGLTEPYLTWSVLGPDGTPTRAQTPVDGVSRPTMVHDMALTPTHVVLVLGPLFFDVAAAVSTGSPMSWEPEQGTRIALVPRAGGATRWLTTDAFWLWHTANAFDAPAADGSARVVVDYVEWSIPGGLVPGAASTGRLARMVLDPAGGTVTRQTLVEGGMEFPRIDDRQLTGAHTTIATALKTGTGTLPTGDADTLSWYDTGSGVRAVWHRPELALGEQVFVPRPGSPDPRAGWWITIATDRASLTSRLLVIPAVDPASGPVATVHLPHRVPLGLHGNWLPTEEQVPARESPPGRTVSC